MLERDVTVGANTTIEGAVVMQGATIGANCMLRNCIVAAGARIGDHCQIDGLSVIGEGVTLGANNQVSNHARLFPGVEPARRRAAVLAEATTSLSCSAAARHSRGTSTPK